MSNGYGCDSCNRSMSESAYIENLGICSECFDRFLKCQIDLVRLEKLGDSKAMSLKTSDKKPCDYCEYKNNPEICKSGYGCRQQAWDLMNEDKDER